MESDTFMWFKPVFNYLLNEFIAEALQYLLVSNRTNRMSVVQTRFGSY